jgi:hypothetical protein
MKFNRIGAITLSAAALSAGILFAAPAASAAPTTTAADAHPNGLYCTLFGAIPLIGGIICPLG